MEERLKFSLDLLKQHLATMTETEKNEMREYFKDDRPKGWLSIEDHLPMMLAKDIMNGCSKYKVRYSDGKEWITYVSDHNTWYYNAKDVGITHWFNE
jgi:uncharacterized protein YbaR (Trm112 family)